MTLDHSVFWLSLMQIIGVNIVLSGDNAVVIALAARDLPAAQQRRAIAWGSGAAVVMRIGLTIGAVQLLRLPMLKLAGAGALLWIALQLLMPEGEGRAQASNGGGMGAAIRTILVADLVMSLDNVIAVAAAAKGSTLLLIVGLGISIPLVVFASTLLLTLMTRFPVIIALGAALLGYVAGEMAVTEPAVRPWIDANAGWLHGVAPALGALGVVGIGRWWRSRAAAVAAPPPAADGRRRILLAIDGSPGSHKVLEHALAMRNALSDPSCIEFHLTAVQPSLPGELSGFGDKTALQAARETLRRAGAAFHEHERAGPVGAGLADLARSVGCELIVMGSRDLGLQTRALAGPVSQSTVERGAVTVRVIE